jgi:hypothetical protein
MTEQVAMPELSVVPEQVSVLFKVKSMVAPDTAAEELVTFKVALTEVAWPCGPLALSTVKVVGAAVGADTVTVPDPEAAA